MGQLFIYVVKCCRQNYNVFLLSIVVELTFECTFLVYADDMKPADVGLAQTLPYFLKDNAKGAPPVAYLHLYECDKFSVSDNSLGYYLAAPFLENVLQDKKYIHISTSAHPSNILTDRYLLFASICRHSSA